MKKLFLIFLMFLLMGCEPLMFGIPQSQWNQLTPEQKNQVIATYNQRKLIETQNAPIQNAINTAGTLIQQDQTLHDQQNNTLHPHFVPVIPPGDFVPPPIPQPPKF